jgi:hypothetical protein
MPCVPPPGGDPAAGLAFVLAPLPVRATMAPHLRVRLLEGDLMEQAQPLPQPCGAVGPCIPGDASGVLRGLTRLAPRGLSAGFAPQEVGQTVRV